MSVALQFVSPGADTAFLLARALFGTVLAFMGLNHFLNLDHMTGYTEMEGLPAPHLGAVISGGMLIFGDLGIALGAFPALAAGAIAVFLIVGMSAFYDFWAVPEDQRESEVTGLLKSLVIFGGAFVFLALSRTIWSYAIGLTLF